MYVASLIFPTPPQQDETVNLLYLAVRQKEYSLKELYARRQTCLARIPSFWSTVVANGPEELQAVLAPNDAPVFNALKSMKVERYQIKSDTEGEPRSLRFTFEFEKNEFFEDSIVVKDFEYRVREDGGSLVSRPVTFHWTNKAKKSGVNKLLDLTEQLYKAEEAFAEGQIEKKERESLWQYEKLREELERQEDSSEEPGFLNWFGFRGAVDVPAVKEQDEEEDEDIEEDGTLDVEIFPAGDDIALALAEDLWPNVMDYFIRAQENDDEDIEIDEEEEDEDAPELVKAGDFEGFDEEDEDEKPPAKKARRS